jgi:type IV secretory pathway VirB10-like protein
MAPEALPVAVRLLRFEARPGTVCRRAEDRLVNTQPPAATPRRSNGTPVAFLALAGAAVLAAGVGGYVAQSHRQAEMPAVEARAASTAPRTSAPAAAAPVSQPAARPEPAPAQSAIALNEPTPVESAAEAAPAVARPRTPEPVERRVTRPAPSTPARAARVQNTPPAAATTAPAQATEAPVSAARTPDPAPAVEMAVREAAPVAEAAPPSQAVEAVKPAATRVSIAETFTIPADSVVGLEIETGVSSQTAQIEDRVDARVTRDVKIDGTTVIPAGSRVRGEVIRVEHGGRFKERARLGIAFHTLVLPDGEAIDIETDPLVREGDDVVRKTGTRIGATAAGGAIIGAIFGGEKGAAIGAAAGAGAGTAVTAAQKPSEARFRAGSVVTVRLVAPVSITLQQ